MSGNDKHIDNFFRDKLNNLEITPPQGVWDTIEQSLQQRKNKQRLFYLRLAAGIALLAATTVVLMTISDVTEPVVNQTIVSSEKQEKEKKLERDLLREDKKNTLNANAEDPSLKNSEKRNNTTIITDDRDSPFPPDIQQESFAQVVEQNTGETHVYEENKTVASNEIQETKPSGKLSFEKRENLHYLQEINKFLVVNNPKVVLSRVSYPSKDPNPDKIKTTFWEITGLYGSVYSDRIISSSQLGSVEKSNLNAVESGLQSFAGGLGLRYNINRWSVESGLYYHTFGQNNRQILAQSTPFNPSYELSVNNGIGETSKSTYLVNNSLGVISHNSSTERISSLAVSFNNNSSHDTHSGRERASRPLAATGFNTTADPSKIIQQVHFLEVPIITRYKVIDQKIKVNLIGGFGANIVTGTQVIFEKMNDEKSVGSISNINEFNVNGTFGIGVGYAVTNEITIHLEPTLKMFLNSLNHKLPVDFYPYQIGIFTGISYAFN